MDFEWDDAKATSNLRKHGVDFIDAVAAVLDPSHLEDVDATLDHGEERSQIIGMAHDRILCVIATMRSENVCRIISARKATRHEQDRYYAADRETW